MKKSKPKYQGFVELGARFARDLETETHAIGRCPFCGKPKHFAVNKETLLWDCKRCGKQGNFAQFLAHVYDARQKALVGGPLARLEKGRGLNRDTFRRWGVGWDSEAELYTIPVWAGARIVGIHRYDAKSKKMFSTSGGKNGYLRPLEPTASQTVWLCEGEWDAMALDEAVLAAGKSDQVVGICGATQLPRNLADSFGDKDVIIAFDNDKTGELGESRAREVLERSAKSVRSVHWRADMGKGYDVRDHYLRRHKRPNVFLRDLERMLKDGPHAPRESGEQKRATRSTQETLTGEGMPRDDVLAAYRKWMYLPDAEVLDVLFGTAFANRLDGDPLWLFLVGPPGCGKSALILTLSTAPLISATSTFTPAALISGSNLIGSEDPSLIPQWDGKVVAIKDFTTMLQMNPIALNEIFGVLRDAYDGECKKPFGTGVVRRYRSRFGIIAGVTPKIEELGPLHTVTGERFIKYYMRQPGRIDVGREVIGRVVRNIFKQTKMRRELEAIAKRALDRPVSAENVPPLGSEVVDRFVGLAQWTAAMRGAVTRDRYTKDVLFHPTAEIGTRLVEQFCKLGVGMALFRGKRRVGIAEYNVVVRIARDSVPDLREEFVKQMYVRKRDKWVTAKEIGEWTKYEGSLATKELNDLLLLGAVQKRKPKGGPGGAEWRLSRSLVKIMRPLNLYSQEKQWQRR